MSASCDQDDELFFYEISASALALPPRLPVTSWAGHIPFLYLLFKFLEPATFVELGVQYGASFISACDAAKRGRLPCKLYGIDTWEGDVNCGFYDGDQAYADLKTSLSAEYPNAQLIRATFTAARERYDGGPIDLLHIDGMHSYNAVRSDYEEWKDLLSSKAVVILHDTFVRERGFGVWRYFQELKGECRTFEFFHSFGLGIVFYGQELPPRLERLAALLESNSDFRELFRALFEANGNSLANRLFDAEQGKAYPKWESFKGEALANIQRLEAENAALRARLQSENTSTHPADLGPSLGMSESVASQPDHG